MMFRAKRSICVLLIAVLTILLIPSTSFAATKKLATPKITSVMAINNDYIKIKWGKCSKATKYSIYRSTQNKNGTFKKVYTTKKLYYNDKNVKHGKTYFYKVKALSSKKSSDLSAAKRMILSSEKIILEKDFYECGYDVSIGIPFIKNSTTDGNVSWSEDLEDIGCFRYMHSEGDYLYTWYNDDWKPYDTFGTIELRLTKNKNYKRKVKVRFIGYTNVPAYKNSYEVPDFGVVANKTEDKSSLERSRVYKFKHDCDGSDNYSAYNSYISLLKKWGYRDPTETKEEYKDSYSYTTIMTRMKNGRFNAVGIERKVFYDDRETEIHVFF